VNSLLGGNSEAEAKGAVEWGSGRDAISINATADRMLNRYDGLSHTVVLNVVQVAEPAPFRALVTSPGLLQKAMFGVEAAGVLALERVVIEPGMPKTVSLDRVDRARYVGIIAAYYAGTLAHNAYLFQIGVEVKTEGIIVKTRAAKPGAVTLDVHLGAERVTYADAQGGRDAALPPLAPVVVPVSKQDSRSVDDQLIDTARSKAVERALK
jgi:hypothetical protein